MPLSKIYRACVGVLEARGSFKSCFHKTINCSVNCNQSNLCQAREKSHQPNLTCTGLADKATSSFLLVKIGCNSFRFNQLQSSANTTKANTVEF